MKSFAEVKEDLAFIEILGKTVLLYEGRLDHTTIPVGFTAYDLRHEDEDWGFPCEISRKYLWDYRFGRGNAGYRMDKRIRQTVDLV